MIRNEMLLILIKKLKIKPKQISLYKMSITHSSYANENKLKKKDNERLEFLGDSVINLLMADYLYTKKDKENEGFMSKKRAQSVCEDSLVIYAKSIQLQNYILLGKGEKNKNINNSILADAFEALFGAIYLDLGYYIAKKVFRLIVIPHLSKIIDNIDFKTQLQELVQSRKKTISYFITEEKGFDHSKEFIAEIFLEKKSVGHGSGKTKKSAEQDAARYVFNKLSKGEKND